MKRLSALRWLALVCVLALAILAVSLTAIWSQARGGVLLAVIFIFTAITAVGLAVLAFVLRVSVARAPTYWRGKADLQEVARIVLMISLTSLIIAATPVWNPQAAAIAYLVTVTLVPAAS